MTKDWSAQMKSKAKQLRLRTNLCHFIFVHENNPITIVLWNQTLALCMRVWLCSTTITKHLVMSYHQYHAWIQKQDGWHSRTCFKSLWWDSSPKITIDSLTYNEQHQLHKSVATEYIHCSISFSIALFQFRIPVQWLETAQFIVLAWTQPLSVLFSFYLFVQVVAHFGFI